MSRPFNGESVGAGKTGYPHANPYPYVFCIQKVEEKNIKACQAVK